VLTRSSAVLIWCWVAGIAALAFALALFPALNYRGSRIAKLIAARDPALAARMRSALELHDTPVAGISPELVAAHLADVELSLSALPAARVVPWRKLAHWSLSLGLVAAIAGGIFLLRNPRGQLL